MSPPVFPLPFEVRLSYCLGPSGDDEPGKADAIHHPLFALLEALRRGGSIGRAAQQLGLSYRHVWGELRRWEADLGRPLVRKVQGQRSVLTPFGERLLELERRIQSRHAARIRALRRELAHVVVQALDESAPSPPRSHSGSPAHPVHADQARVSHEASPRPVGRARHAVACKTRHAAQIAAPRSGSAFRHEPLNPEW